MTVIRTSIGVPQAAFVPFRPSAAIPRSDTQSAIEYVRSIAAGGLIEGVTAPPSPTPGMLWWDTVNEVLSAFIPSIGWLDISSASGGGGQFTAAAVAPASPTSGSFWWNTTNETFNTFISGIGWVDISSAAGGGQYSEGPAPPASPQPGTMWFDTTLSVFNIYNAANATWISI